MAKALLAKDGDGAVGRKRPRVRRIIGVTLLLLVVAFTVYTTVSMHQRIEAAGEAEKPMLQRALQNNLIVCAGFLIVAVGITFDVLTSMRFKFFRIVGYTIWGLGILIAAEAVLMSAAVLIEEGGKEAAADTPYVLVLGKSLGEKSEIPSDLSERLNTAVEWQKGHEGSVMIVTGAGKATKNSAKKNDMPGLAITARKSDVDIIGMSLTDRGIPEDSFLKIGRCESDEQSFENLLKADGIEADTPIAVVIDNFDMDRTRRLAEAAGFTSVTALPTTPSLWDFGTVTLWKVWNTFDPNVKPAEEANAA